MRNLGLLTILIILAAMLLSFPPYAKAQDPLQSKNFRTYEVTYEDHTFAVKAAMPSDGSVDGIEVYPEYGSILLTLDVGSQSGQGELTIVLPRGLIDSKEGGVDSEFLVIVDGEAVEPEDLRTETERTLTFPLPEDAFEVEIFGTQVVPEFTFALITIASSAMIGLVLIFQRIGRIRFSL